MSDIPFALKYRPKKLSEVIGQPVVVKAVGNAFKSDTLHHAYLLSGKFGAGKTSVARIMAAMSNCEKSKFDPCGECDNCKAIFNGNHMDVKELDAASNRGIDDIRDLRRRLSQSPIQGKEKYVILDECHSLTGQAAEAALKLIEEPPKRTRFILCTTDPHKLIDTIHSRCISFAFNKVGWIELFKHLKYIAKEENLDCEENALKACARNAQYSVRNALQNLQAVVNYVAKEKITEEAAKEVLGEIGQKIYFVMMDGIARLNAPKAMKAVNIMFSGGKNSQNVINGLSEHLDNLLKVDMCHDVINEVTELTDDELAKYKYQLQTLGEHANILLIKFIDLLAKVNAGIELNLDPQMMLDRFIAESVLYRKAKL